MRIDLCIAATFEQVLVHVPVLSEAVQVHEKILKTVYEYVYGITITCPSCRLATDPANENPY